MFLTQEAQIEVPSLFLLSVTSCERDRDRDDPVIKYVNTEPSTFLEARQCRTKEPARSARGDP